MSILIKGVTLENFKPFCPCMNGEYGDCDIPGIKRCYGIGKDGCPLIEIPPHGRLIDADALKERIRGRLFEDEFSFEIDCAPTIIPEEGGE